MKLQHHLLKPRKQLVYQQYDKHQERSIQINQAAQWEKAE